jgi:hypothetical protein
VTHLSGKRSGGGIARVVQGDKTTVVQRPCIALSVVRRSVILAAFVCLFIGTTCAVDTRAQQGARSAQANLNQLVQGAQTIVRGFVVSAKVEPHPQFPNLQTVVVTMQVSRVLKGEAAATYTFRQFVWDERDLGNGAGYRKAGEVLLLMNPVSQYGLTSPVGLEQGRFRVTRDAMGKGLAVNGRGNIGLFQGVPAKASEHGVALSRAAQTMMQKTLGQAPLDTLEDTIVRLAGAGQ